jgi:hypothetical protein
MTTSKGATVREAVGIFHNADSLKEAINDLLDSGFRPDELGLLASEEVVERSLGDLYERTNENAASSQAPAIAFIGRDSIGEAPRTLGGSLFFVGTSGAVGGVVASAAVFGGAALAAVGGLVGVGMVGALVAAFIHQSDAEYLQQEVDEGHILLFARIDSAREKQAMDILKEHSGLDVKMYDIPVKSSTQPNLPNVVNA